MPAGATSRAPAADRRVRVLFVRAPELGRVKTRLAAELGTEAALRIYREMGTVVAGAAAQAACTVRIACTPDDGASLVRAWLGDIGDVVPQGGGDLGVRMAEAASDAFADGAERVVIVGSDCPAITTAGIEEAFARLDDADVVVGPAADGGYYLIGMTRPRAELFAGIPWSCADTCRATLAAAASAGCRVALLGELSDVDTADDWRRWHHARSSPGPPA